MVDIDDGQHAILEGINGSGKTFYARNGLLPLWSRVVVCDTENMEFGDFPAVSVATAVKLLASKHTFYVRIPFSGDLDTDLEQVKALSLGIRRKVPFGHLPSVVYYDEFTDFADATTISPSLRSQIRTSRKRNVSIVAGTQRPQLMNKTMVANAQHKFYFFMSEYDAEQIKSYAPFVKERLNEIPYGSYRCLYQAPDSSVITLAPVAEYDWASRLRKK